METSQSIQRCSLFLSLLTDNFPCFIVIGNSSAYIFLTLYPHKHRTLWGGKYLESKVWELHVLITAGYPYFVILSVDGAKN